MYVGFGSQGRQTDRRRPTVALPDADGSSTKAAPQRKTTAHTLCTCLLFLSNKSHLSHTCLTPLIPPPPPTPSPLQTTANIAASVGLVWTRACPLNSLRQADRLPYCVYCNRGYQGRRTNASRLLLQRVRGVGPRCISEPDRSGVVVCACRQRRRREHRGCRLVQCLPLRTASHTRHWTHNAFAMTF